MAIKLRSLSLNLPFGLGGVEMEVSQAEANAAWQLYVELATRVSTQPLGIGAGSVREALDSLYALFAVTRSVLRSAGPEVGRGPNALGPLAIEILNVGLRPFVVRWHTELRDGEGGELTSSRRAVFDQELQVLRIGLGEYVSALAQIAGIAR